jgi:hypothetical protein
MTRGFKALAAVAVVAALVVFAFQAVSQDDQQPRRTAGPRSHATVPPMPDGVPPEGMYVVSDVLADGQVKVQTWVRAPHPITRLRMTTTDPDLLPGSVESLGLVVRTMDGTLLAHRTSIGTNHQTIRLRAPAQELWFSYTVDGGLDDATSTVPGRKLARVLGMDVDYEGASGGVVRRMVTATGTVLNVACLRPRSGFQASPRACGKPTPDGGWVVDLEGKDRRDRLLASLEA